MDKGCVDIKWEQSNPIEFNKDVLVDGVWCEIDDISMREIYPDGFLGPNLLSEIDITEWCVEGNNANPRM